MAQGGIYTEEELKSWSQHIMFGDLHSAIVKSITLGVCNGQGMCPASPESPAYHLNNLINPEHFLETVNPIKHQVFYCGELRVDLPGGSHPGNPEVHHICFINHDYLVTGRTIQPSFRPLCIVLWAQNS